MSTPLLLPGAPSPAPAHGAPAQLADVMEQLALLAGDGCLLVDPAGRLVLSRLRDRRRPTVVDAVLSGDARDLERALSDRRTTGLLNGGPVLSCRLDALPAVRVPLRHEGQTLGDVWLLLRDGVDLPLDDLAVPLQRLVDALLGVEETPDRLAAALDGEDLPGEVRHVERFWVCRLLSPANDVALTAALAGRGGGLPVVPVRGRTGAYLVVFGLATTSPGAVLERVEQVRSTAADRLRLPVTAGLSLGCAGNGLHDARRQADAVAAVAPVNALLSLPEGRSVVFVALLREALADLPPMGADLVQLLRERDAARGTELVRTLSTWLASCCETVTTAERLSIHPNTLRYRLQQAEKVTGLALRHDMDARLELRLRLLEHGCV